MLPGHVSVQGGAAAVVMFKHHPPDIVPPSPAVSSFTYRLQIPSADVPLKTLSEDEPETAGAGAGKISAPSTISVGLNVPLVSALEFGRLVAAESSRVMVNPLTAVDPPTSDKIIAF